MLRYGILVAIVGGVLFFLGALEWRVARQSSAQPEEIALKELIARGVDGNPNILLKDFSLCDNFVFETKRTGDTWTKVWVPVVPAAPGSPPGMVGRPRIVQALVFSIEVRSEQDLIRRCAVPRLRALVTNKIVSLGSSEKKLLQESYPETNFSTCLIIQEGREPAGGGKLALFLGGGALLFLAGGGMVVYSFVGNESPSAAKSGKKKRKIVAQLDEDEDDEAPPKPAPRSAKPKKPRPDNA